ncbi:MAG: hypothetical protein CML20_17820 [Rheinheimera sp.]|nr:hypothetical protein [Rheinheimera sp.]
MLSFTGCDMVNGSYGLTNEREDAMLKQISLWLALSAVLTGLANAADYAEFTTPGLAKGQITHDDIAPLIRYYQQ